MSVGIERAREKAEALMTLREAPLQNRVFMALLGKGGPRLVLTISRETRLSPNQVRFALRALMDKGLVSKSPFSVGHYRTINQGEMIMILSLIVTEITPRAHVDIP